MCKLLNLLTPNGKSDSRNLLADGVTFKRWRIQHLIGRGGFSEVYKAQAADEDVAIKVTRADDELRARTLILEQLVLSALRGIVHIPRLIASGTEAGKTYIVMELLGKNLHVLRKESPGSHFSVATTLGIGLQCVDVLQTLHGIGYLHRDVKPANLCVGLHIKRQRRRVFLLDFGLAKKYTDDDGNILQARQRVGPRGTPRYASLNSHHYKDPGRVDDFWCLYYSLIEMVEGQLPWRAEKKSEKIREMKERSPPASLCSRMTECMAKLDAYLTTLGRDDTPDYLRIKAILLTSYPGAETMESPYDWELPLDVI